MNFSQYQEAARVSRLPSAGPVYAMVGLSAEVGEVQDKFAKGVRDGVPDLDAYRKAIAKELGDVLWFISAIADDNCLDLGKIAQMNIDKLTSRQERGVLHGSGDDR